MIDASDVLAVPLLILISLVGRAILIYAGQRWISTFAHTATLTILPIVTFIVTKVISGNIALSLGMVGALSIVRFRNPVKSPFELSVYFASITMGITASVSLSWLAFFVCAIFVALLALMGASKFGAMITGKPYFETSFSEGNSLSTLEIQSSTPILALRDNENLISESKRDQQFSYILASDRFNLLKDQLNALDDDPAIVEAQLNR